MIEPFVPPDRAEVITEKVVPEGEARKGVPGTIVKLPGKPFFLHYAFDGKGRVRKISYSSKHESADLRMLLSVACDYASRLLQVGWTVAEVAAVGADQYMAVILERAAVAERLEVARLAGGV